MRRISKLLSVAMIVFFLSTRILVFAQEVTPEPTAIGPHSPTPSEHSEESIPTSTPTHTPTPTPDNSLDETSANNTIEDSNEEIIASDPDHDSAQDILDVIASNSSTVNTQITNDNNAHVENQSKSENNTGSNKAIENIDIFNDLIIKSGDAKIQENRSNIINTNIVGENIITTLLNFLFMESSSIDLSHIDPCTYYDPILSTDISFTEAYGNRLNITDIYQRTDSLGITNNNTAHVLNDVEASAITGHNESLDNIARTAIDTGNAHIDVNMFNMINTNLIGECGYFGVFNFFSPQSNSLILPYEKGFIDRPLEQATITSLNVVNDNKATSTTDVDSTNTTGGNEVTDSLNFTRPPAIYTGKATTEERVLDLANMSYTLDNFLYLRIQHYGNWTGNLIGWDGLILEGDDYIILARNNQLFPQINESEFVLNESRIKTGLSVAEFSQNINEIERNVIVKNNNDVSLLNKLLLQSDTGSNKNGNIDAEIRTGDSLIETDIFNLLNTNIIGRNWFFGIINFFEPFSGDIVFPRADLAINVRADKNEAYLNDVVTYSVDYKNIGYLNAENTSLVAVLPENVEFIGSNKSVIKSGRSLIWAIGKVSKQTHDTITFQARIVKEDTAHAILNSVIYTTSDEMYTNNNSAQHTLSVAKKSVNNSSQPESTSTNSDIESQSRATDGSNVSNESETIAVPQHFTSPLINAKRVPYTYRMPQNVKVHAESDKDKASVLSASTNKEDSEGIAVNWLHVMIAYVSGVVTTVICIRGKSLLLSRTS